MQQEQVSKACSAAAELRAAIEANVAKQQGLPLQWDEQV